MRSLVLSISFSYFLRRHPMLLLFFFFNDTATTEIYTLSLHDALPISYSCDGNPSPQQHSPSLVARGVQIDRKSTRLNSSHQIISYAVFCLKKKKKNTNQTCHPPICPHAIRSSTPLTPHLHHPHPHHTA